MAALGVLVALCSIALSQQVAPVWTVDGTSSGAACDQRTVNMPMGEVVDENAADCYISNCMEMCDQLECKCNSGCSGPSCSGGQPIPAELDDAAQKTQGATYIDGATQGPNVSPSSTEINPNAGSEATQAIGCCQESESETKTVRVGDHEACITQACCAVGFYRQDANFDEATGRCLHATRTYPYDKVTMDSDHLADHVKTEGTLTDTDSGPHPDNWPELLQQDAKPVEMAQAALYPNDGGVQSSIISNTIMAGEHDGTDSTTTSSPVTNYMGSMDKSDDTTGGYTDTYRKQIDDTTGAMGAGDHKAGPVVPYTVQEENTELKGVPAEVNDHKFRTPQSCCHKAACCGDTMKTPPSVPYPAYPESN